MSPPRALLAQQLSAENDKPILQPPPTEDPDEAERRRAGARKVEAQEGSKEARRRERERRRKEAGEKASRNASPSSSVGASTRTPSPHSESSHSPTIHSLNPLATNSATPSAVHLPSYIAPAAPLLTPSALARHSSADYFSSPTTQYIEEENDTHNISASNDGMDNSGFLDGLGRSDYALPKEYWKPDSDSDVCDRISCQRKFGFWGRRHHCRKCGGIFCAACSSATHPLLLPAGSSAGAINSSTASLSSFSTTSPISSAMTIIQPLFPDRSATPTLSTSTTSSSLSSSPPTTPVTLMNASSAATDGSSTSTSTNSAMILQSRVCLDCKSSLSSPLESNVTITDSSSRMSSSSSGADYPLYDGSSSILRHPSLSPARYRTLATSASINGEHTPTGFRSRPLSRTRSINSNYAGYGSSGPNAISNSGIKTPPISREPSRGREPWMGQGGVLGAYPLAYGSTGKARGSSMLSSGGGSTPAGGAGGEFHGDEWDEGERRRHDDDDDEEDDAGDGLRQSRRSNVKEQAEELAKSFAGSRTWVWSTF